MSFIRFSPVHYIFLLTLVITIYEVITLARNYNEISVTRELELLKKNNFYTEQSPYDKWVKNPIDVLVDGDRSMANVKGALVVIIKGDQSHKMRMTMRELEQTYNRAQGYPYVFLSTEDLSDEFKMSILTMTNAPVYFSKIPSEQWGYPKKKNRVGSIFFGMSEKNKNIDRNLEEEMFKTRYILKFLHDHPVLKNVDYVWRVTPGASYYCALDIDPFLEMKKSKQKYGFVAFSKEISDSEKFLGNVTEKWISENINNLAEKTMVNWNINDPSAKKRICRFSTSIEIFDTNFLRSSEYDSFMSAIDESGGIFKENWSIDGVRTALISTILKKNDVRWFEEIGYTDDDIRHCPKPHGMALKCVFCKWNKDGPYKSNCYKKFQNLTDIPKLTLLERIKDDEYAFL